MITPVPVADPVTEGVGAEVSGAEPSELVVSWPGAEEDSPGAEEVSEGGSEVVAGADVSEPPVGDGSASMPQPLAAALTPLP